MVGFRLMAAACAVALSAAWLDASAAAAAMRQAEIVIDARSGEVLHARDADTPVHPASLTKMMTLYLVFEAVGKGKLKLDQTLTVSRFAAAQPASKVGFRAGQRVTVRDLIRGAAVRSTNDSAVVLAEAVAGDEKRFAALMTRKARALGMSSTTFKNASGLTAAGQMTTARDMATLGLRLMQDWPQYYNLFGRESTPAFGRTVRTTNRLLGQYRGMDGIKTGYTRAAGFNLVSSAERGGVRIVAALLGGHSSAARFDRMAALLDLGFKAAPATPRRVAPSAGLLVANAAPPAPRPGDAAPEAASLFVEGARALGDALTPAAANAAEARPVTTAALDPASSLAPRRAIAPTPRGGDALAASGDWAVQLGAFAGRDQAVAHLASAAFGEMPALALAGREVARPRGASLYRARLTGLDPEVAREACRRLKSEGRECLAVAPAP